MVIDNYAMCLIFDFNFDFNFDFDFDFDFDFSLMNLVYFKKSKNTILNFNVLIEKLKECKGFFEN